MTKRCRTCRRDLPLEQFGVKNSYKGGFNTECRRCASERCRRDAARRVEKFRKLPPQCHANYTPTPAEIAAACEEIQRGWEERDFVFRTAPAYRSSGDVLPVIRTAELGTS